LRVARELVEQELSSPVDYPIEPISGLAEMFQSNRVGELQMIVALLAALIGGAIGAATTLIAAG
jgi:hypothetical protein